MTDQTERLQMQNENLRLELRAIKAEKAAEYHRAEKLKAQLAMLGRVIEVLRKHATDKAKQEAEAVFKNG